MTQASGFPLRSASSGAAASKWSQASTRPGSVRWPVRWSPPRSSSLPKRFIKGVHDSKQLTPERREELYDRIIARALAWGVGVAEPLEIDRLNIYWATREASLRALAGLGRAPGHVLVDGRGIARARASANPDRRRRPQELLYRGRLDPGQGDPRPDDVRVRRAFSRLRLRAAQGLLHARALRRAARARTVANPSPLVRARLRRRAARARHLRLIILSALG